MCRFAARECAPIFFGSCPKKTVTPGQKKGALVSTVGPSGQLWTRRGVPERDRWWSMLDSALGAGAALLNLLALRHANWNCEVGQRLKGPAALVAAALWFLVEVSACGPYTGPGSGSGARGESFLSATSNLHPSLNLRRRSSKPAPGIASPSEANVTAQAVCSEAEHTGLVAESLSLTTPDLRPHPQLAAAQF